MRTYVVRVQGGREWQTAYLIDHFMAVEGIGDVRLSAFEREKFERQDELFRRGAVGYVVVMAKEEIDVNIWFRVREYLAERGYYASWPKKFDPKELRFGPFLRAVLEKIHDFAVHLNARIFSAVLQAKEKRVTYWKLLHTFLGLTQEAHDTFARWVSWIRPVSGIDTG
ncbi:MAG: hypothetical protein KM312_05435 [Hydrogenibacillus schlegelii]|uniref:Uncharacterized protein n=1 Tax=Hydrogenibacillus schlegelii TaxID=1484 RepID=A0A947GBF8_HYDSH|nr:hypothetical protein [Hydrogenibacillus schlegelii]